MCISLTTIPISNITYKSEMSRFLCIVLFLLYNFMIFTKIPFFHSAGDVGARPYS